VRSGGDPTPTLVIRELSVSSRSQASPAAADRLRTLPRVRLERLPRMADFAIWATACETAFWSTGTFARCYEINRRASIGDVVDADPVAACVREIMATRSWTGTAADLRRVGAGRSDGRSDSCTAWPKSPRELAGRLRRVQTFLRALGIDIAFARKGRAGNRVIGIRVMHETVSTVSNVRHNGCQWGSEQPPPAPTGAGPVAAADDADGTDANAGFRFG
jgi:hypothetical protein